MKNILKSIFMFFLIIFFSSIFFNSCSILDPKSDNIITLVNARQQSGTYLVLWNQLDKDNKMVSDGNYRAILKLDSGDKNASFKISSNHSHVQVPYDSSGNVVFPFSPPISVNSSTYAKGDTVCIQYELSKSQNVKLDIEKD